MPPQAAPGLTSCLFRHDSVRASIKKKVRCSESAEVIPPANYFVNDEDWREMPHEDDDDVFSDSAPVQTSRGNMCTPFIERKGSLPGPEALPDWFPNSRLLSFPSTQLLLSFFVVMKILSFFGCCFSSHCAFVCLRNFLFFAREIFEGKLFLLCSRKFM
jgi:hypothetical protein